jgi:hypothetical protein
MPESQMSQDQNEGKEEQGNKWQGADYLRNRHRKKQGYCRYAEENGNRHAQSDGTKESSAAPVSLQIDFAILLQPICGDSKYYG